MIAQLWRFPVFVLAVLTALGRVVGAYKLDLNSTASLKSVSQGLARDLMSFYTGHLPGQTPGLLPEPYYWWEGGALMGAMIDYWFYTRDNTYNEITTQGLLFQVGPDSDYMPPNQTLTEGNDDQGFWGMAVMAAAEYNFPNPPKDQPQWLALAQAVFNTQAARWDADHCNGGLRWQIFPWNNGYDYKNSISQACFFNIAARLALYTGNTTYANWAVKTWNWMESVNLIDKSYRIHDGVHINDGCVKTVPYEFSYNVGAFLHGASAMYAFVNMTNSTAGKTLWQTRVDGLLNATEAVFFWGDTTQDKVMIEIACEPVNFCNKDQQSFKAYLSRWMAATTKWAPWTFDRIKTLLGNSAIAAVNQCVGGDNGQMCGLKWANNSGRWDGTTGVGPQMAAMEVVLANMIQKVEPPPVTSNTGGTSPGNPLAGTAQTDGDHVEASPDVVMTPLPSSERAGAFIGTAVVLIIFCIAVIWMLVEEGVSVEERWANMPPSHSDDMSKLLSRHARALKEHKMDDKVVLPTTVRYFKAFRECSMDGKIAFPSGFLKSQALSGHSENVEDHEKVEEDEKTEEKIAVPAGVRLRNSTRLSSGTQASYRNGSVEEIPWPLAAPSLRPPSEQWHWHQSPPRTAGSEEPARPQIFVLSRHNFANAVGEAPQNPPGQDGAFI